MWRPPIPPPVGITNRQHLQRPETIGHKLFFVRGKFRRYAALPKAEAFPYIKVDRKAGLEFFVGAMNNAAPPKEPVEQFIRKADPCVMVIFGATGDLTKRKLLPALCNLVAAKLLPGPICRHRRGHE